MLELYQFEHSPFCLKVRLGLNAKKLSFRIIEIKPGIGQVDVFRLSGQRKVPILKDRENVISDSTSIIEYLESITKDPKLIPEDPKEAAIAHVLEDWADTTLSTAVRLELIKAVAVDPSLREALLPEDSTKSLKSIIKSLPFEFINGISEVINPAESQNLIKSLEKLSNLISPNKHLVGDSISLADIAVSAQLSFLRFPYSSGSSLYNKGCPGFCDNPELEKLFQWRDEIEEKCLRNTPALL